MAKRAFEPLDLKFDRLATPVGELLILADGEGRLRTIDWTDHEARMRQLLDRYYGKGSLLDVARARSGRADEGDAVVLQRRHRSHRPATGRDHRHAVPAERVAAAERKIRGVKTITYGELARRLGNRPPPAPLGHANGRNPISIVVPCHRVIGSAARLTGYGGGLPNARSGCWSTGRGADLRQVASY